MFYVCFGEASGLGISQPLSQVQESLEPGRGGSAAPEARALPLYPGHRGTDLIVLHLHIIHIQIQADGGAHGGW